MRNCLDSLEDFKLKYSCVCKIESYIPYVTYHSQCITCITKTEIVFR